MADEPQDPLQPAPEPSNPSPAPAEQDPFAGVLSQSEVDALIASTLSTDENAMAAAGVIPGGGTLVIPRSVQPYKFRPASFLAPGELRRVRIKHEEFAINLASPLSQFTRCGFSVRLSNMEMVTCRTVIESMDGPSHLTMIRLEPMPGLGLIEVSLPMALTIVSRLQGSKGMLVKEERNLSEIEMALMNGFVDIVTNEYANLWRMYESKLKPVTLQNETSARFLKMGSDSTEAFLLTLEARFNDCTGTIKMAFLHSTLQPLIERLVEEISSGVSADARKRMMAPTQHMLEIPVPVDVCWNGLTITVRDLCQLKPNDVLMLDPKITQNAVLNMGRVGKYNGTIGRKGSNMAFQIKNKI